MSKVLLISPGIEFGGVNIGLGYMNRELLNKGYNTMICDYGVSKKINIDKIILAFKPDFTLISITNFNLEQSLFISKKIRVNRKSILIAGGPYLNLEISNYAKISSFFDYGIAGEGEKSISKLLGSIRNNSSISNIPGVIYYKNNKLNFTKNKSLDIEKIGFPLYNEEIYSYFKKKKYSYILLTSRGCPYKCVFCPNPILQGDIWRGRSVESVVAELKHIKMLGINSFNIMDDNFTYNQERSLKILKEIKKFNFKFILGNGIRADTVNDKLAYLLKKSGCMKVPIGVENGDPKTFKYVKKSTTLSKIQNSINILKKNRLNIEAFMIIGLINEDKLSLERSLNFIKKNKILARWYIAMPIKGTEFYNWVKENGNMLPFDNSTKGTWSAKPPLLFETKKLTRNDLMHYFYYLNSEVGNFLFLSAGNNYIKRFFTALYNLCLHNPKKIPLFFLWCIKSIHYGEDLALNTI